MSRLFEELDYRVTELGALSLRRRASLTGGEDIYEVLLGSEYLMSSRFTVAETALATMGLAACPHRPLDVVVGGLGLGYTAKAALEHPRLSSLIVVDGLAEVIEWHRDGLLPLGRQLTFDPRSTLLHGDFFALCESAAGFDPRVPHREFDAILVDIDHSPTNLLHPDNARFYEQAGLERLRQHLKPRGIFALWSNDPPSEPFHSIFRSVFTDVSVEAIAFPALDGVRNDTNTLFIGRR